MFFHIHVDETLTITVILVIKMGVKGNVIYRCLPLNK
jgi:predicted methyltransferase MtxX (methanogen marker protein 4)